ncbi:MAG TPA: hypothetical protein VLZ84_12855, partial [Asticcacaulis sp.]|nr:hypothetical protein [Asticcacaulis sp.]
MVEQRVGEPKLATGLSNFTLPFIHPDIFYDGTYFYSKGGAIFVGSAQGSLFGITCKHATEQTDEKKDWQNLIIISKTGQKVIQPNNHFSLWEPTFQEGGDLSDIMIFRYGKIADLTDHIPSHLDMNHTFS